MNPRAGECLPSLLDDRSVLQHVRRKVMMIEHAQHVLEAARAP